MRNEADGLYFKFKSIRQWTLLRIVDSLAGESEKEERARQGNALSLSPGVLYKGLKTISAVLNGFSPSLSLLPNKLFRGRASEAATILLIFRHILGKSTTYFPGRRRGCISDSVFAGFGVLPRRDAKTERERGLIHSRIECSFHFSPVDVQARVTFSRGCE